MLTEIIPKGMGARILLEKGNFASGEPASGSFYTRLFLPEEGEHWNSSRRVTD
jgi:hypothetical protein